MCRIVGILRRDDPVDQVVLTRMRDTMTHGGPDAAGLWIEGQIGLAQRRLSIIDLTERANQPFHWRQYALVYNGEIYNYQALRSELEALGYTFITQSDTEVLIVAFHEWGVDAPKRFHGMFAFAIWDKEQKQLWLCRDRVGVKPLYVYERGSLLLFASEMKALLAYPAFDRSINRAAVAEYMHYGYIPAPESIYRHVRKLLPGTIECIRDEGDSSRTTYWSARAAYEQTEERKPEELEGILQRSFQYRMIADVPVGVFLSGGIDSSLLCAVLAKHSPQPINTFTIGFHEKELDEAPYARAIADHLGTRHQELYCSATEFEAILPDYFQMYDEPFGDSSGIPTYLVSKLAQQHVKVALSADGADELFGGYTKYQYTARFIARYQKLPTWIRNSASRFLASSLPLIANDQVQRWLGVDNWRNKLLKGIQAFTARDILDFFQQASGYFSPDVAVSYQLPPLRNRDETITVKPDKQLAYLGLLDIQHYLEGDILCKVDRASMYTALESREPFLDQDLIEYALQLADSYKYQHGQGKVLLRSLLQKYMPAHLFQRPKHGFRVPIGQWLRELYAESLRALAEDKDFCQRFGLDPPFTHQRIRAFLRKNASVSEYEIWFLFALYQWDLTWNRA
ncbi:MAG: asparagine synthase (glutamine-hydrolyzing) [Bacteroidetes bacterium]|nr:MAG: asparagine synthase (glutamine-hydrolyzing) [Bacteroidota bacterium]